MIANELTQVDIAANLARVRKRMAEAARRADRAPDDVLLVAVSKMQPFACIETAAQAGQVDFGENRIEELWPKVALAQTQGFTHLRWHMIGTIQSRKTADLARPLALVHSVDRVKIAERLSRDAVAVGLVLDVLFEVNVSGEPSKHGFAPAELVAAAADLAALPGIRIQGLMTMAPLAGDAEATRPVFRNLRLLRDELRQLCPQAEWRHLSMGMTNDFEIAVEEGSTIVRIGSAIFGAQQ